MENNPEAGNANLPSSAAHLRVQKSTTLNRRYVKKPGKQGSTAIDSVAKRRADDLRRRQAIADKINRERLAALKSGKSLIQPVAVEPTPAPKPAAQEPPKPLSATIEKSLVSPTTPEQKEKTIKESTLKSALKSASAVDNDLPNAQKSTITTKSSLGLKRVLLAFGCAAIAVGVIGYFVSTNTPDLSVRVIAMQSGIDATYPSYVPRGYSLSDIVSGNEKIEMTFTNSEGGSFVLSEEKSAWDNETLETSYAKETWSTNYTSIREQGVTIFISGSDAAWVNGGILYKLNSTGNNLTKKQIKSIVTSL